MILQFETREFLTHNMSSCYPVTLGSATPSLLTRPRGSFCARGSLMTEDCRRDADKRRPWWIGVFVSMFLAAWLPFLTGLWNYAQTSALVQQNTRQAEKNEQRIDKLASLAQEIAVLKSNQLILQRSAELIDDKLRQLLMSSYYLRPPYKSGPSKTK